MSLFSRVTASLPFVLIAAGLTTIAFPSLADCNTSTAQYPPESTLTDGCLPINQVCEGYCFGYKRSNGSYVISSPGSGLNCVAAPPASVPYYNYEQPCQTYRGACYCDYSLPWQVTWPTPPILVPSTSCTACGG